MLLSLTALMLSTKESILVTNIFIKEVRLTLLVSNCDDLLEQGVLPFFKFLIEDLKLPINHLQRLFFVFQTEIFLFPH